VKRFEDQSQETMRLGAFEAHRIIRSTQHKPGGQ
jgi:hypothetical protein